MTLEAIKEAIAALPAIEKTSLVSWLNTQESMVWDKQIEADFSPGGAGLELLKEWDAEIKTGHSVRLEELLAQPD